MSNTSLLMPGITIIRVSAASPHTIIILYYCKGPGNTCSTVIIGMGVLKSHLLLQTDTIIYTLAPFTKQQLRGNSIKMGSDTIMKPEEVYS